MLNPVPDFVWKYYQPMDGVKTMLELGQKKNVKLQTTYKAYFESIGIEHTSIDWHEKHGAINRDLRKPLWDEFGTFDMVTNIGTTEHVTKQFEVWENIHNMTKPGGWIVSHCPSPGNWPGHGLFYPTREFYFQLAKLNGYEIERIGEDNPSPYTVLQARLFKLDNLPFTMPDESTISRC